MHCRRLLPLTVALLLPLGSAQAAPPRLDFADLPAYLTVLNHSADPEAQAIRRQIAAGPADLARERIAAEKAGLLTRPAELQPPLPPEDQNAAPLYKELDALRKQKPLHLPLYAQPMSGRYAYTPAQIAAVRKEYDARQDIFTLLHQATDRPKCVFVHDYSSPTDSPFLDYAGLRESAREINTESLLMAYAGDYPQAVANQERGFRIAAQVAAQSTLISFLVGSAIEAITLSGLQSIVEMAGPNAALDSRAEADILALNMHANSLSLGQALRGEAAIGDTLFSQLGQAKPADIVHFFPSDSLFLGRQTAPADARFTPAQQAEFRLLRDAAQADYLHQLRRLVAAANQPSAARQAVFGLVEARASASRDNPTDPIQALSDLLDPVTAIDAMMAVSSGVGGLGEQADRLTARRETTAAGAAVLAARAQTGAFPDSLPPGFTDSFTGKPLGYRREETNGFVVYSAGPDGTFDGGKPGDPNYGPHLVFRYPLVTVPIPQDMLK